MIRAALAAVPPFRLDLTVAVLQRLATNPVEVWRDGRHLRAFETPRGPVVVEVVQPPRRAARVEVVLHGPAGDPRAWLAGLERRLGLGVDLARFHAAARREPAVAQVASAMRGVKPPRFDSLHEAFASVVLFQQVSLQSAIATLARLVAALSPAVEHAGLALRPFPPAERIADSSEAALRALGLSAAKARSLRGAAAALASGALREADLEPLPTEALVERLRALEGVGPWTASLLALRYFGRLDVFPPGDVAAARALGEVSPRGAAALLDSLGPHRGMLYYLLFLRRLALARSGPFAAAARVTPIGRPR